MTNKAATAVLIANQGHTTTRVRLKSSEYQVLQLKAWNGNTKDFDSNQKKNLITQTKSRNGKWAEITVKMKGKKDWFIQVKVGSASDYLAWDSKLKIDRLPCNKKRC